MDLSYQCNETDEYVWDENCVKIYYIKCFDFFSLEIWIFCLIDRHFYSEGIYIWCLQLQCFIRIQKTFYRYKSLHIHMFSLPEFHIWCLQLQCIAMLHQKTFHQDLSRLIISFASFNEKQTHEIHWLNPKSFQNETDPLLFHLDSWFWGLLLQSAGRRRSASKSLDFLRVIGRMSVCPTWIESLSK